jgi:hypothetical protein
VIPDIDPRQAAWSPFFARSVGLGRKQYRRGRMADDLDRKNNSLLLGVLLGAAVVVARLSLL